MIKYYKVHLNINEEYSDYVIIRTDQEPAKSFHNHILLLGNTILHIGGISYFDSDIEEITSEEAMLIAGTFDPIQ